MTLGDVVVDSTAAARHIDGCTQTDVDGQSKKRRNRVNETKGASFVSNLYFCTDELGDAVNHKMTRLGAFALMMMTAFGRTSAGVHNFTVYRITPRNYTGLTNLDSGDAAGDAFFGLYELSAPVLCTTHSEMSSILCTNHPLLQIGGFNVYNRFTIEADDRFGEYLECNPSKTPPHDFECRYETSSCWCT